jgi:uncharacterized protein (TIGR00730 family)
VLTSTAQLEESGDSIVIMINRVCVFCGGNDGDDGQYRDTATDLGQRLAKAAIGLVYGAGGTGIMGAVSRAALAAGGEVIGVIPQSLIDRELGDHQLPDLRIVSTMHERKTMMHNLSDAFVVLPGGLGTLEEFFEIYTWAQLGFHAKPIIIVNVNDYYSPLIALLDHMSAAGFMTAADRDLIEITVDAETTVAALVGRQPL